MSLPTLPYTPDQSEAARKAWKAACGHHSIAAATGKPLESIRTAGVPLRGWMNPTMIVQTLAALQVRYSQHRAIPGHTGWFEGKRLSDLFGDPHSAVLRVQFEGPWMKSQNVAAHYRHTHYIAFRDGAVLDPLVDPHSFHWAEEWLSVVTETICESVPKATGWHYTHLWHLHLP